jgi:NitT/TauT family transport system substrate-binding protein
MAGLLDGSLDVAWGGPMRIMKARNEAAGPPLVCFCEVVRKDPFYLLGRPRFGPFKLTDLPKLKLGSVSEVPTPWLCLQHDLREAGIDPGSIRRVTDRSMAQNLQALGRGEIDVAQMFEPYASMGARQKLGHIVYAASGRGLTSYTTLIATRDAIMRLREPFAAMSRAVRRTLDWIASHRAAELTEVVAEYFPQVAARTWTARLRNTWPRSYGAATPSLREKAFSGWPSVCSREASSPASPITRTAWRTSC